MSSKGAVVEFPIEREYQKNNGIKQEDISKLRQWLQTQPHLPSEYITDLDLAVTYHCCGRSSEVTKQVLDLHYTLKTLFTPLFKDRQVDKVVEQCLNAILYAPLPQPTVEGYRVIYLRLLDIDPRNFHFSEIVRTFMMVFDLWQYEEGTWPGFVILIDMDQSVIGHIARLDIMTVRQALYFLQEAMLVKLKGVHFLNAPSFMDKLMMLIKPFMKKALLDVLQIHQIGSDIIYKYVPKECFPQENGGQYKPYATIRDELLDRMRSNTIYIKEENRKRVQEAQRPGGKKTTVENLFGIEGSFKKLDID